MHRLAHRSSSPLFMSRDCRLVLPPAALGPPSAAAHGLMDTDWLSVPRKKFVGLQYDAKKYFINFVIVLLKFDIENSSFVFLGALDNLAFSPSVSNLRRH